jgi:beta-lactamase regulating signal transducer with metallopeptidase domain
MIDTLSLFWTGMIDHLWQASILLGALFLLEKGLRRAPARIIHTIWIIGLIRVILPFSILKDLALELLEKVRPEGAATELLLIPSESALAAVINPSGALSGLGREAPHRFELALIAVTLLWAGVTLILLIRTIRDLMRAGTGSGERLDRIESEEAERLKRICILQGIGIDKVKLTCEKLMPGVIGVLRPRIIIPALLAGSLDDIELAAILLHEENHRRRRDPLRLLLTRLGLAFFHFYPLVYPLARRLHTTAEFDCDEMALRSGIGPLTYAKALTKTLRSGLAPGYASYAAAGRGVSDLRIRFRRLFESRRHEMTLRNRSIITLAVISIIAGLFLPAASTAGGEEIPPQIIKTVDPEYPKEALKAGIYCKLILKVLVDEKGDVKKAEVVDLATFTSKDEKGEKSTSEAAGNEALYKAFEQSVLTAVYKWKFKPATRDGNPVEFEVKVPVDFKLH